MADSMDERVARAKQQLASTEAAVAEAEEELSYAEETAWSADRSVRATVGPQGDVRALYFPDAKYRGMAPGQLSSVIVEAITRARTAMSHRVMDVFQPLIEDSDPQHEVIPGFDIDWERIFGPDVAGDRGESPLRGNPDNRLRDEIVEDA